MKMLLPFLMPVFLGLISPPKPPKVLVFSKTAGFRHESITDGKLALLELGNKYGFKVDTTELTSAFTSKNLKKYAAVVFLNTTGDVLDAHQEEAFMNFIRSGGGFAGIHAASDTEYEWEWYGKLVGGYFESHPEIQEAKIDILTHNHLSTMSLPGEWVKKDEWYNFQNLNPEVKVLMKLNTDSYKGSKHPGNHPIAWYHEYDGGRVWYTGLGHTSESYSDSLFLQHLLGAIRYAMGK